MNIRHSDAVSDNSRQIRDIAHLLERTVDLDFFEKLFRSDDESRNSHASFLRKKIVAGPNFFNSDIDDHLPFQDLFFARF